MWCHGRVLIQESGHLDFSLQLTHYTALSKSVSSELLCPLFVQLRVQPYKLGIFFQLCHLCFFLFSPMDIYLFM